MMALVIKESLKLRSVRVVVKTPKATSVSAFINALDCLSLMKLDGCTASLSIGLMDDVS